MFSDPLQQSNDLIVLYRESLKKLTQEVALLHQLTSREDVKVVFKQLEEERLEHAKTRCSLAIEREKLQEAESEAIVLRKQLEREKATFENAFGLLNVEVLADSSRNEDLIARCSALEALCSRKEEELAAKEESIHALQSKLAQVQAGHKHQMEEMNIKLQQELYMAKTLSENRRCKPLCRYKPK